MESINGPKRVKEHNLNLLRKTIFQARQATRQQLSALTGISTVTLGSLLQRLLDTGEALEGEQLQPTSGRPARIYSYNPCRQYCLLLSVGFEKTEYRFRTVLIDLYGRPVWEESLPAVCLDGKETLDYLERLTQIRQPVGAISIGLPGIGFGEYLHKRKNEEYLSLAALEEFSQKTGIPIRVENDVNLAAMGYAGLHHIGKQEALVYLYLMQGTFSGSAVFLDGHLHLGKGRFAGEKLPSPLSGGFDRRRRFPDTPDALEEFLFTTLFPYLAILAPHHLAIVSDYIQETQLRAVEGRLAGLLGPEHCPDFTLTRDFWQDYQKGLELLALEQLAFPVGKGDLP